MRSVGSQEDKIGCKVPWVRHTNTLFAMPDRDMRWVPVCVIDDAIWRLFAPGFHCSVFTCCPLPSSSQAGQFLHRSFSCNQTQALFHLQSLCWLQLYCTSIYIGKVKLYQDNWPSPGLNLLCSGHKQKNNKIENCTFSQMSCAFFRIWCEI